MAPSLRMTREEREAFLAGLHVGVISIEDPGRAPLTAPIWYDYTPESGVWVLTAKSSLKGLALERAGRYSIVAQQEEMPYKYVSVEGPVISVQSASTDRDTRPMARRYLGAEAGDAYADQAAANDGDSILVRMRPERWLTVNYGKR